MDTQEKKSGKSQQSICDKAKQDVQKFRLDLYLKNTKRTILGLASFTK